MQNLMSGIKENVADISDISRMVISRSHWQEVSVISNDLHAKRTMPDIQRQLIVFWVELFLC